MKIAAIGECMMELSRLGKTKEELAQNHFKMNYGGDTLNTLTYLSRYGVSASYVTALGDDPYSQWLMDNWRLENIGTDLVKLFPNKVPGLYMIETDDEGERSFFYWRDSAPVRNLLDAEADRSELFSELQNYDAVYLSGITLSLFKGAALPFLIDGLTSIKQKGVQIIFDGNYRPKGWESEAQAQAAFNAILAIADICLPTFEDEEMLFGDKTPQETAARMHAAGVEKIVVKQGAKGCLVSENGEQQWVDALVVTNVVDTTGAGDSFNGGCLSQYLQGKSLAEACLAGHRLASVVIQHKGAIISKDDMPTI